MPEEEEKKTGQGKEEATGMARCLLNRKEGRQGRKERERKGGEGGKGGKAGGSAPD